MHYSVRTERVAGEPIPIHCPACGASDEAAIPFDRRETLLFLYFIPVFRHTTTWVRCPSCAVLLHSSARAADLGGRSADELAEFVRWRASFAASVLAVLALLCSVFPFLGLVFALIVAAVNRRSPGWPRRVSRLALVIAALTHLALVAAMLIRALA